MRIPLRATSQPNPFETDARMPPVLAGTARFARTRPTNGARRRRSTLPSPTTSQSVGDGAVTVVTIAQSPLEERPFRPDRSDGLPPPLPANRAHDSCRAIRFGSRAPLDDRGTIRQKCLSAFPASVRRESDVRHSVPTALHTRSLVALVRKVRHRRHTHPLRILARLLRGFPSEDDERRAESVP